MAKRAANKPLDIDRDVWVTLQRQQYGHRHEHITGFHLSNESKGYRDHMNVIGARSVRCRVLSGKHVKRTKAEERSYYSLAHEMIDKNAKLRDQFIGTLMLLAYDGCISDSRARELASMDAHEWRKESARLLK